MPKKNGIVWLASYPKSGNTWFRIFLSYLLTPHMEALNLNSDTLVGTGSAARMLMDKALGFNSLLLTEDELSLLRASIYRWYGKQEGVRYFKIHDAFLNPRAPHSLIPAEVSLAVLYFVRNPLDVVISLAHHMSCTIDEAIKMMNNPFLGLKGSVFKSHSQIRQICSSWSYHVQSWINNKEVRLFVLRYEDMHAQSFTTFSKALDFIDLNYNVERITKALELSSFAQLKQQEQEQGFRESAAYQPFFRKGMVGDWEKTLSEQQVDLIINHHGAMMGQLGYLDEYNRPVTFNLEKAVES